MTRQLHIEVPMTQPSQDSTPGSQHFLAVLQVLGKATQDTALQENRNGTKFLVDALLEMKFERPHAAVVINSLRHQRDSIHKTDSLSKGQYADRICKDLQRGIDRIILDHEGLVDQGPTLFDLKGVPSAEKIPVVAGQNGHAASA